MSIDIVSPIDIPGWDEQILELPGSSFFHSSAWAKVLSETYKYKPTYFTSITGNKLISLLPVMDVKSILTGRRGVSLPFTDFCEPIVDNSVQFHDLFECIVSQGKSSGWKYIELRGGQHLLSDTVPSQTFLAHTLDLSPDEKKLMANLRDSTRRNIKKAISGGVTVRILNTIEAVIEFYRLNCLTRKEHGLPPQPGRFFQAIHRHVISQGLGFVALAYFDNKAIAGNVYFHFGQKAIYKYGASNRRYQKLRANNLVMWEAIKWHCLNGYKELHFGRSELDNEGLHQFKDGWGATRHEIKYYNYDLKRGSFVEKASKLSYSRFMSKIPVWVLKPVGAVLYRHSA